MYCYSLTEYRRKCIERFEGMDIDSVSAVLHNFLGRYGVDTIYSSFYCPVIVLLVDISLRGDFKIAVNGRDISAFSFLENAMLKLMEERRPLLPLRIFPVMLWSKLQRNKLQCETCL